VPLMMRSPACCIASSPIPRPSGTRPSSILTATPGS
jgi:hypothetical protein